MQLSDACSAAEKLPHLLIRYWSVTLTHNSVLKLEYQQTAKGDASVGKHSVGVGVCVGGAGVFVRVRIIGGNIRLHIRTLSAAAEGGLSPLITE